MVGWRAVGQRRMVSKILHLFLQCSETAQNGREVVCIICHLCRGRASNVRLAGMFFFE